MKKSVIAMGLSCVCMAYALSSNAGQYIAPKAQPSLSNRYYVNLEASTTWANSGDYEINGISSPTHNDVWGGRLSVGGTHPLNPKVDLIAEIGGGYYGSTHFDEGAITGTNDYDGYDLLVGGMYHLNNSTMHSVDLFGDIGFMALNVRSSTTNDLSKSSSTNTGSSDSNSNSTQVLPEVKVGGLYNITDNLAFTLSYLHVFGSTPNTTRTTTSTGDGGEEVSSYSNTQAPTLNSILFGVRYYIQ